VRYHVSLNVGERYTTSGVAALIVALAPGMTLFFAVLAGVERFTKRAALGLAVAFGGVCVVVLLGAGEELSVEGVKGPLIVLGAPLAFAIYNVLLTPLLGRYDVLALTAATSLVGTVGFLPFLRPSDFSAAASASFDEVALVLYLGVLSTLLGYVAWNIGLRAFGATRAVSASYAIPAIAVLIGAVTLEEPVTALDRRRRLLIVGGVALASSLAWDRGRGRRVGVDHAARPRGTAHPTARAAEPPSRAR
jgi:drug/metabolite transporter (DMT)-like permease